MPTDTSEPAPRPVPKKIVIGNAPDLVAPSEGSAESTDYVAERVDLPSAPAGKAIYPNSPAQLGFVKVRAITTQEEEILATERFWRQGTAIDMVLSRCIVTKGVNTMDLLSGDRTHLLMFLRSISFGPEYSFDATLKGGHVQTIKTDVSKLQIRSLPADFVEPYTVQVNGVTYECRLSRGADEMALIQARMQALRKDPKGAAEPSPTLSLRRAIVSVNGNTDADAIAKHVKFLVSGRAQELRRKIAEVSPGPMLNLEVVNEATGSAEEVNFQMTEGFFRS